MLIISPTLKRKLSKNSEINFEVRQNMLRISNSLQGKRHFCFDANSYAIGRWGLHRNRNVWAAVCSDLSHFELESTNFYTHRMATPKIDTLQLQDRDLALLRGLFECRVMTTDHATALYFDGNYDPAKKRLQKLTAAGLICDANLESPIWRGKKETNRRETIESKWLQTKHPRQ